MIAMLTTSGGNRRVYGAQLSIDDAAFHAVLAPFFRRRAGRGLVAGLAGRGGCRRSGGSRLLVPCRESGAQEEAFESRSFIKLKSCRRLFTPSFA